MKKYFLIIIALLFTINVYAQPSTISYQGVLTDDGGTVITGTPNIAFALFDAATNGNQLWTETHNNVTVTNGLFQVELNSVATNWGTANFATDMWLQITVGATTLTPRVAFNASGYSLAGKATSLQIASGAGEGKVLTSDANGNGSWQNANSGGNLSTYGSFSITSIPTVSVGIAGVNLPLEDSQVLSNVTIDAGNYLITLLNSGKYLISYNALISTASLVSSRVVINGSDYPPLTITPTIPQSFFSSSAIVSISAGSTLSLQFFGVVEALIVLNSNLNIIKISD